MHYYKTSHLPWTAITHQQNKYNWGGNCTWNTEMVFTIKSHTSTFWFKTFGLFHHPLGEHL